MFDIRPGDHVTIESRDARMAVCLLVYSITIQDDLSWSIVSVCKLGDIYLIPYTSQHYVIVSISKGI